jgi:hypothetical protein
MGKRFFLANLRGPIFFEKPLQSPEKPLRAAITLPAYAKLHSAAESRPLAIWPAK